MSSSEDPSWCSNKHAQQSELHRRQLQRVSGVKHFMPQKLHSEITEFCFHGTTFQHLVGYSSQHNPHSSYKLFRTKRFGDVVVGTLGPDREARRLPQSWQEQLLSGRRIPVSMLDKPEDYHNRATLDRKPPGPGGFPWQPSTPQAHRWPPLPGIHRASVGLD
jgi:hypothetical protein